MTKKKEDEMSRVSFRFCEEERKGRQQTGVGVNPALIFYTSDPCAGKDMRGLAVKLLV